MIISKSRNRLLFWGLLVLAIVVAPMSLLLGEYLYSRADPSKVEAEQAQVFSDYLFRVPSLAKPLPPACGPQAKWAVFQQSLSLSAEPSHLLSILSERKKARWVERMVFESFAIRNLSAQTLQVAAKQDHEGGITMIRDNKLNSDGPSARFAKVGFNQDFTQAMFFAEISCGRVGSEFVIMERDKKHGNYWYAVRTDPQ